MYYFNTPILATKADAIIVPVGLDACIVKGTLHWDVARQAGDGYRRNYYRSCRSRELRPGEPGIFVEDDPKSAWEGRVIFDLPSIPSLRTTIGAAHVIQGLVKILEICSKDSVVKSLAVPKISPTLKWGAFEDILFGLDPSTLNGVELWLYPEYNDTDEFEEDVEEEALVLS